MNITETLNEGLAREYQIVITAAELDAKIEVKLQELAQSVKMPGFRPGKVPMGVVKARFGDQAKGEVIRTALDDGAKEVIENGGLRLASQPSIDIKSYEDGSDLEAVLTAEVMPEIALPDFSKMSVERPTMAVDEAEVEDTLNRIGEENRPTNPARDGKKAEMGDTTVIDFVGRIDGEAFEGGAGTDHPLKLGSNRFIPGFEDGLVGAKKGDTLDVPVTFPAEYQAAHLAGKDAVFEVTVKDLLEDGDVTLDDELATKLGFEKLDDLRNAIRDQIGMQHAGALRQAVKKNVLDELAKDVDFEVPPSLYKSEYEQVARAMKAEAGIEDHSHDHNHDHDHDHDHDHHHPAADEGLDDAQKEEAASVATRRVRLGLLLTEVGTQNDVQVTEEDSRKAVFEQARNYPGQEQQVLEFYQKKPEAMQQLAGPIFENKVIDYILEIAQVTEKTVTVEELYGEAASEEAKPAAKKAEKAAAKKTAAKKAPAKKAAAKKATAKKK